ncbi:hypothetical protein [Flagellimonas amoyensis]|uniref:hypothetical protein n=1 Tax=Flagellimonas amoyensis TaxID=2169401 RepID=UPI000D372389|nr:hypothetical protein [Allomuricauda amoyensis]
MGFLRRLGWYLVGLSIGIVFLVFFLKKKSGGEGMDFCYFPNCRVLKDMRSKPISFGDAVPEAYRDTLMVKSILADGNVDFRKSDTKAEPCKVYYVSKKIADRNMELQIRNCQEGLIIQNTALLD